MNRNELKSHSGCSVQILLDGKEEVVTLTAENPEEAFLELVKTSPSPLTKWADPPPKYHLTDQDIAGLIPNGPNNFFSRISLTTPTEQ